MLRFNGTSANVVPVANSTQNDLSTSNSTLDPVVGAAITGVWWSVTGNTVTIARGANTTMTLSGTGHWDRNTGWSGGGEFPAANLVVTFNTSAAGVLFVEVDKNYAGGDYTPEHP